MAKINNQDVIQKLIDELGLYPGLDIIPTEVADKILPTFQVNSQDVNVVTESQFASIVRGVNQNSIGTTTMYTTPTSGNFYLTNLSVYAQDIEDTANSATTVTVTITISGSTQFFRLSVGANNGSQGNGQLCLNFQNPILIDKGTNITINNDSAQNAGATIVGYNSD